MYMYIHGVTSGTIYTNVHVQCTHVHVYTHTVHYTGTCTL